jgi:hypothetical protein
MWSRSELVERLGEPFIQDNIDKGEPSPWGEGRAYLEGKPYRKRHEPPLRDRRQYMIWQCGGFRDQCHAIGSAFTDQWHVSNWCTKHRDLYNDGAQWFPRDRGGGYRGEA